MQSKFCHLTFEFCLCEQYRFADECKKRWQMSDEDIDTYWTECLSDPSVPKGFLDLCSKSV